MVAIFDSWNGGINSNPAFRSAENQHDPRAKALYMGAAWANHPTGMEPVHARQVASHLLSTLAMVRQGFGFAIYTSLITEFNQLLQPHHHKLITYSLSSISAKLIAMVLEAPLTLLKTRMEVIHRHQKSLLQ